MPFPFRADRIVAWLWSGLLVLPLFGCQSATLTTESTVLTSRRAVTVGSVRSFPEYQSAVSAFSKGNRAKAKKNLLSLSEKPSLSEVDKQFLQKQIALCDGNVKLPDAPPTKPAPISTNLVDCGPKALQIAAEKLGVKTSVSELRRSAGTTSEGTSLAGLEKAAKSAGLKAESLQVDKDALAQIQTPAVAWLDGNHFVALLEVGRGSATLHDPNDGKEKEMPLGELLSRSGGIVLTLKKG
jgi:Peptidase C39 family